MTFATSVVRMDFTSFQSAEQALPVAAYWSLAAVVPFTVVKLLVVQSSVEEPS